MLICLALSSEMLEVSGFSTFLQKFVHLQFHMTEGDAALAVGCMVVPGIIIHSQLVQCEVSQYKKGKGNMTLIDSRDNGKGTVK